MYSYTDEALPESVRLKVSTVSHKSTAGLLNLHLLSPSSPNADGESDHGFATSSSDNPANKDSAPIRRCDAALQTLLAILFVEGHCWLVGDVGRRHTAMGYAYSPLQWLSHPQHRRRRDDIFRMSPIITGRATPTQETVATSSSYFFLTGLHLSTLTSSHPSHAASPRPSSVAQSGLQPGLAQSTQLVSSSGYCQSQLVHPQRQVNPLSNTARLPLSHHALLLQQLSSFIAIHPLPQL